MQSGTAMQIVEGSVLDPAEIARRKEEAEIARLEGVLNNINKRYGTSLTRDMLVGDGPGLDGGGFGIGPDGLIGGPTGVAPGVSGLDAANSILGIIGQAVPGVSSIIGAINAAQSTSNPIGIALGALGLSNSSIDAMGFGITADQMGDLPGATGESGLSGIGGLGGLGLGTSGFGDLGANADIGAALGTSAALGALGGLDGAGGGDDGGDAGGGLGGMGDAPGTGII